jgi:hypothetical protein
LERQLEGEANKLLLSGSSDGHFLSEIALRVKQETTRYGLNCSMETDGYAAIRVLP